MRKILIAVAFTGVAAAVALGAREHFLEQSDAAGEVVAGEADRAAGAAGGTLPSGATRPAGATGGDSAAAAREVDPLSQDAASPSEAGGAAAVDVDAESSAGAAQAGAADAEADAPAPGAGSSEPETDDLLRATAAAYESLASLRADFVQHLENPLLGKETTSRGTLFQRRPDRFLLRFSQPEGDVIVSDGSSIWVYYPSLDPQQVVRARASAGGAGALDLQAQFVGDPVARFRAERHPAERVDGRLSYPVTLTPREPAGYESLKVWIDARDHLVRRFEIHELSGIVRRFELSDLERNPDLPDALFEFEPPAGATIVERG